MLSALILSALMGSSFYFDNRDQADGYLVVCGGDVLDPCQVAAHHDACGDLDPYAFNHGIGQFSVFYLVQDGSGNKVLRDASYLPADLPGGGSWTQFPDGYYGFNDGDWTYDQDLCAARANARPGIRPGGRNRVQEPPAQFEYTITNALEVPVLFLAGDSIDSPGRIVKGGQITLRSPKFAHVTVAAGLPGDEIKILHFHSTGPAGGYPPGQYRLDNSSGFVPDPAAGPRHPEQPRP